MHVNEETFATIFLSPAELGDIRCQINQLTVEHEIDWAKYPALDRLTDAIIHPGTSEV